MYTLTRNGIEIASNLTRRMCLVLMERIKTLALDEGHDVVFSGLNNAVQLQVGRNTYMAVKI